MFGRHWRWVFFPRIYNAPYFFKFWRSITSETGFNEFFSWWCHLFCRFPLWSWSPFVCGIAILLRYSWSFQEIFLNFRFSSGGSLFRSSNPSPLSLTFRVLGWTLLFLVPDLLVPFPSLPSSLSCPTNTWDYFSNLNCFWPGCWVSFLSFSSPSLLLCNDLLFSPFLCSCFSSFRAPQLLFSAHCSDGHFRC